MKFVTLKIAARSVLFYSKASVNQIIVIALLAAIITGSLFTGFSVRKSLKMKADEKLGNTDVIISSGLRFFNASLADRIADRIKEKAVSIIETDGYVQNFETGVTALNTAIYGVGNDFFQFSGKASLIIEPGTVAINTKLARSLGTNVDDELIIHFREMDPLPANAPFAPSKDRQGSLVLKVGKILTPFESGDFSTDINQIVPMNLFINISDLESGKVRDQKQKANRMLIQNMHKYSESDLFKALSEILTINDIGLTIRKSEKTGNPELISDRIFIDSAVVSDVLKKIPSAWPLITYLANSIETRDHSTPYSFVTALPPSGFRQIARNEIIINAWLASDIQAETGDTIRLTWYNPGDGRQLVERSKEFIIGSILDNENNLSDPSLMPDFPGISASTTCSGWDAGVPVMLDKIREKDEDYWNRFRGTPKAFISYSTGIKLWGNNFGPATAIRFTESMSHDNITQALAGYLDPTITGFTVIDIRNVSRKAAGGGVDFSTLFLALSIFIILSCLILLSLAVSMFFGSRKDQVKTYFALGFKNSFIKGLLFTESLFLAVAGAVPGIFLGYFINKHVINALNSVWRGAVQTDTLIPQFGILPLTLGFVITIVISGVLLLFAVRSFLKNLFNSEAGSLHVFRDRRNLILLLLPFLTAVIFLILSFVLKNSSTILSFIAGSIFFVSFVLAIRHYYVRNSAVSYDQKHLRNYYSKKFYSFYPSHAITPVIFIAAGIFTVMITGANRQVLNDRMLLPKGGTGGYMLWIETAVPFVKNLNTPEGRKEFGLGEPDLNDLKFVQAGKVKGNDASCLNLNHVTSPPLLGLDPDEFIKKNSFSFVTSIKAARGKNAWSLLNYNPGTDKIYGIADQTVIEWGLKIKTGDTLRYTAENGQLLEIIICGGLKSSVFQGNLIIGEKNLKKYFPSVGGTSVLLVDGDPKLSEYYREILSERLSEYGPSVETTGDKLASFFRVTNTYLNVFMILSAFGMILGVAGMGFILIRNFNQRKREFAFMMATGYSLSQIRKNLLNDQIIILLWGILTGTVSGFISTLPSLLSGSEIPWRIIIPMIVSVTVAGFTALLLSVRIVQNKSLVTQLRKE